MPTLQTHGYGARETADLWAAVKVARTDHPHRAVEILRTLCRRHPAEYRYAWCMAEVLMDLGQIDEAADWLAQLRKMGAPDAAREAALTRLELHAAIFREERAGRLAEAIAAYHAGVQAHPHAFKDIETWAPRINGYAERIFKDADPGLGDTARDLAAQVHAEGVVVTHWDDLIGDQGLFEDLIERLRDTQAWTVPGKPHFFKAAIEEDQTLDDPMIRTALHPALLDTANAFYGLFSRLVSANIVQTRLNAAPDRVRRGSEEWHRDPEDTPMFKAFVYLFDVTEPGHGPFQYIPKSRVGGKYASLMPRFGRGVFDMTYKAHPDPARVEAEVDPADIVTVYGRAGTVFLGDTSAFHRGGFCTTRDRYVVPCVYQRPGSQYPSKLRLTPGPHASEAVRWATKG